MRKFPNTYSSDVRNDPRINHPSVFDPALKHFPQAIRQGEPLFQDLAIQHHWFKARQQVMQHLLVLIGRSHWAEHLVLRGSLLLKAWLGDMAREPGDIDWVFRPATVTVNDPLAKDLFNDLIQMVTAQPHIGSITLDVANITTDQIWTYERVEGRRIVLPWTCVGLPSGALQMDVVFSETLFVPPVQTPVAVADSEPMPLWSASKALSLAWKVLWLETDLHPQGKDLYDATLLAEHILVEHILAQDSEPASPQLPSDLLRQVLEDSEDWRLEIEYVRNDGDPWIADFPWVMEVGCLEWSDFQQEYPWVQGSADEWIERLSQALRPMVKRLLDIRIDF